MNAHSRTSIAVPSLVLLALFSLLISAVLANRSITTNAAPTISALSMQQSTVLTKVAWNETDGNEDSPADGFVVKTYAVADLVTPAKLKNYFQFDGTDWSPLEQEDFAIDACDFDPLIELIKITVKPDSWEKDGNCHIKPFEESLSLVVKQDEVGQDQIADILKKLRQCQDMSLLGRGFIVVLNPDTDERNLPISFEKAPLTLSRKDSDILHSYAMAKSLELLDFPVSESFNGQECQFKIAGFAGVEKADIQILQVAHGDPKSVRLSLTIRKPEGESKIYEVETKSGQFTAFDVSHLLEVQDQKRPIFCFRTDIIDLTGK